MFSLRETSLSCAQTVSVFSLCALRFIYKVCLRRKKRLLSWKDGEQRAEAGVLIHGAERENSSHITGRIPTRTPTSASGRDEHREVYSDQTSRQRRRSRQSIAEVQREEGSNLGKALLFQDGNTKPGRVPRGASCSQCQRVPFPICPVTGLGGAGTALLPQGLPDRVEAYCLLSWAPAATGEKRRRDWPGTARWLEPSSDKPPHRCSSIIREHSLLLRVVCA